MKSIIIIFLQIAQLFNRSFEQRVEYKRILNTAIWCTAIWFATSVMAGIVASGARRVGYRLLITYE